MPDGYLNNAFHARPAVEVQQCPLEDYIACVAQANDAHNRLLQTATLIESKLEGHQKSVTIILGLSQNCDHTECRVKAELSLVQYQQLLKEAFPRPCQVCT